MGSPASLELDPSQVPQHEAYSVVRASRITEHAATAVLYRHRTGAHLLSVLSSEEEKVFGAAFKTPVSDDTGVPHILEHSVLCGSKKCVSVTKPGRHLTAQCHMPAAVQGLSFRDNFLRPNATHFAFV